MKYDLKTDTVGQVPGGRWGILRMADIKADDWKILATFDTYVAALAEFRKGCASDA